MDTLKKILLLTGALLVLASCSKFLEEKRISTLSAEGAYDTERMLESNIDGILGLFITKTSFTGEGTEYLSLASGIIHHGLTSSTGITKPYYVSTFKLTQYSSNSKNSSFFRICYSIVNACNVLLDHLPASPVDSLYKSEIAAEAKFYRAYAMFCAVRIWGDCPIKTCSSSLENIDARRNRFDSVYVCIVNDLKDAEKGMRTPQRVQQLTPGEDRVNKYAATALLSTVYATIGSLLTDTKTNFWNADKPERNPDFSTIGISKYEDAYALALECAEKLIPESGVADPGSTYRLAESYADLFDWDPAVSHHGYTAYTNPERIFVLPITANCDSYLAKHSLPPYPEGVTYVPNLNTSNSGRWRPNRWLFQKWCETYPGEKVVSTKYDLYRNSTDPRLALTMYSDSIYNESTKKWSKIYPTASVISTSDGKNIDTKVVFPYLKKHWSRNYHQDGGEADSYQIRLAEIYLNAAEAAAWLGDEAKAYKYIEVLHARARKSVADGMPEAVAPKWESGRFASKEDLCTAIFWERMFELLGEQHEYYDVHRWGATWLSNNITKVKNEFNGRKEQEAFWWGGYVYPHDSSRQQYLYPEDPQELRKSLLYAYPNQEINYNNSISSADQNDFWWNL